MNTPSCKLVSVALINNTQIVACMQMKGVEWDYRSSHSDDKGNSFFIILGLRMRGTLTHINPRGIALVSL